MKRRYCKRGLCLLLAILLGLSLCACTQPEPPAVTPAPATPAPTAPPAEPTPEAVADPYAGLRKEKLEHVYTARSLHLPEVPAEEGLSITSEFVDKAALQDGSLYLQTVYYYTLAAEPMPLSGMGLRLYRCDPDGEAGQLLRDLRSSNERWETGSRSSTVLQLLVCPDGSYWYSVEEREEDWSDPQNYQMQSCLRLIREDAAGQVLNTVDVTALTQGGIPFSLRSLHLAPGGEIVLQGNQELLVLDAEGSLLHRIALGAAMTGDLCLTGAGDLVFWHTDLSSGETRLKALEIPDGSFRDLGELPAGGQSSLLGGMDSSVITGTGVGLTATDYVSGESETLLNWLNSGISGAGVVKTISLADGRFLINELDSSSGLIRSSLLSRVPEEAQQEYYILRLAVLSGAAYQDAVLRFNRQSEDLRIVLTDYSGDPDQLDRDILDGQGPDLFGLQGMPFDRYARAGLLADTEALLKEAGLDPADYHPLLLAGRSEGVSCSIIPFFHLMTVAARAELVGTEPGWTMEELQALLAEHPGSEPFGLLSRPILLNMFQMLALPAYVDMEAGTCSFEDAEFLRFLEFAATVPETFDIQAFYTDPNSPFFQDYANRYRNDRELLSYTTLMGYQDYRSLSRNYGGDVSLIGFPVPEGKTGSTIVPQLEIGVAEHSPAKGLCGEFIRFLLSEEYQRSVSNAFPVEIKALQALAQEALAAPAQAETGPTPVGGLAEELPPLTEAQLALIDRAIDDAGSLRRDLTPLLRIIEEEAGAFFAGDRSAEETAAIIQSRAQLYISEQQ